MRSDAGQILWCESAQEERETPHLLQILNGAKAAAESKRWDEKNSINGWRVCLCDHCHDCLQVFIATFAVSPPVSLSLSFHPAANVPGQIQPFGFQLRSSPLSVLKFVEFQGVFDSTRANITCDQWFSQADLPSGPFFWCTCRCTSARSWRSPATAATECERYYSAARWRLFRYIKIGDSSLHQDNNEIIIAVIIKSPNTLWQNYSWPRLVFVLNWISILQNKKTSVFLMYIIIYIYKWKISRHWSMSHPIGVVEVWISTAAPNTATRLALAEQFLVKISCFCWAPAKEKRNS